MYISKTEGLSNIICQSKTDRGMSRPGSKVRQENPQTKGALRHSLKYRASTCVELQSLRNSQLTWGLSPLPKVE